MKVQALMNALALVDPDREVFVSVVFDGSDYGLHDIGERGFRETADGRLAYVLKLNPREIAA